MAVRLEKITIPHDGDVWFFAYGSLMWQPEFDFVEVQPALLYGYHRAFCVRSEVYRGTPERPGLVLGLDRGGACRGRAFRVAAASVPEVAAYLEQREMQEDIYTCKHVTLHLLERAVPGCAFVVNRGDVLYEARTPPHFMARRIAGCAGERGSNRDYLAQTIAELDNMGIRDQSLHALLRRVDGLEGL